MLCLLSELPSPKECRMGEGLSVVAFCAHTLLLLWVRDNHNCVVRWHKLCQQRGHALNCVSSKALMGALPSHLSGQMCNSVLVRSKGRHQAVAEIPNMQVALCISCLLLSNSSRRQTHRGKHLEPATTSPYLAIQLHVDYWISLEKSISPASPLIEKSHYHPVMYLKASRLPCHISPRCRNLIPSS